eukprot:TRINITY_DN6822_c0_g1_i1.p1 TRINITY_DN6822_c0_g1~~TRINITY_DN6822_c0_g1_i1.p1  ORF type:complete len:1008 (-),score=293.61 TRINITY_DN6822_c0_g1_i1:185-3208(-)
MGACQSDPIDPTTAFKCESRDDAGVTCSDDPGVQTVADLESNEDQLDALLAATDSDHRLISLRRSQFGILEGAPTPAGFVEGHECGLETGKAGSIVAAPPARRVSEKKNTTESGQGPSLRQSLLHMVSGALGATVLPEMTGENESRSLTLSPGGGNDDDTPRELEDPESPGQPSRRVAKQRRSLLRPTEAEAEDNAVLEDMQDLLPARRHDSRKSSCHGPGLRQLLPHQMAELEKRSSVAAARKEGDMARQSSIGDGGARQSKKRTSFLTTPIQVAQAAEEDELHQDVGHQMLRVSSVKGGKAPKARAKSGALIGRLGSIVERAEEPAAAASPRQEAAAAGAQPEAAPTGSPIKEEAAEAAPAAAAPATAAKPADAKPKPKSKPSAKGKAASKGPDNRAEKARAHASILDVAEVEAEDEGKRDADHEAAAAAKAAEEADSLEGDDLAGPPNAGPVDRGEYRAYESLKVNGRMDKMVKDSCRAPRRFVRHKLHLTATMGFMPSQALQLIIDNPGKDINEHYDIKKTLGVGSFGSVKVGKVKATRAIRAVKAIVKDQLKSRIGILKKEIEITKMIDHPNLIKLYETYENDDVLFLVMELCMGGSLFDRVDKEGSFSEMQSAVCMNQVLRGIFYMHKNFLVHRDIKPENVLIKDNTPIEKSILKVSDFGLSTNFKPGQVLTARVGTVTYMAPEVVLKSYTELCDIWSCGVMLYFLLSSDLPFWAKTEEAIHAKILKGKINFPVHLWRKVSREAQKLIKCMLKLDPSDRFTIRKCLDDGWFKQALPKREDVPIKPVLLTNLRGFRALNKLHRAGLAVIASMLREEQIRGPREVFLNLDVDGDGEISVNELKSRLERATERGEEVKGTHGGDINALLAKVYGGQNEEDAKTATDFTYTEFLAASFDRTYCNAPAILKAAFSAFDRDGSGDISLSELANGKLLGDLDLEEITQTLEDLDMNGDAEIDFEEFCQMMKTDVQQSLEKRVARSEWHGHGAGPLISAEALKAIEEED